MSKITKYVGLDVHKDSIAIEVAEEGRSEVYGIPHGLYRWMIQPPGGHALEGSVTVLPGQRTSLDIRLAE